MLNEYKAHVDERAKQNIPPLPLSPDQTSDLIELLKSENDESEYLLNLLKERVPAGVDQSAYVKAAFLADITSGKTLSPYINKIEAVRILGTMLGGYNIEPLIKCLKIDELGDEAANALSNTLLIFDAFNEILELSKDNKYAKKVINSWAEGEWFTKKTDIAEQIKLTVYKVPGEINTDDNFNPDFESLNYRGEVTIESDSAGQKISGTAVVNNGYLESITAQMEGPGGLYTLYAQGIREDGGYDLEAGGEFQFFKTSMDYEFPPILIPTGVPGLNIEIDIGVGGRPLIIYVLNLLFESRISDFFISPSKLGNKP